MTAQRPDVLVVTSYKDAPTRTVSAGGVDFAYRELGSDTGVPGRGPTGRPLGHSPAGARRERRERRMVPTTNSVDLARRLPDSDLVVYPDAGHGGIFQFHEEFVAKALEFLEQ